MLSLTCVRLLPSLPPPCPLPAFRYGEKAAKWTALDQTLTLAQLLSKNDYVVPGVPLLFAVAKGTDYRNKFLAQNQG